MTAWWSQSRGRWSSVYTGSREQAQRVADLVGQLAKKHELTVDVQIAQWHPVSEEWESPDEPLPATAADTEEELEERVEDEREESAEQGYPDFEVRDPVPLAPRRLGAVSSA